MKIKSQAEEGNSPRKSFLSYHISQKGNTMDMEQLCLHEPVSILHELDLGQHTLIMMSEGSIDLLANDAQTPSLADSGLNLDSDEMHLTVHLSARIGEVQDVDELVVRY